MIPPNIQSHIDELIKDAEAHETDAASCRRAAAALAATFGVTLPGSNQVEIEPENTRVVGAKKPKPKASALIAGYAGQKGRAEHIREIMLEAGRPLKPKEVTAGLRSRGFPGPPDNHVYYSSVLNTLRRYRNKLFVSYPDATWYVAGMDS